MSAKIDLTFVAFVLPVKLGEIVKYILFSHSFIPNYEKVREHIAVDQVYEGNVLYLHNPVLNYAMSNAVVRTYNGYVKIDKDATRKRIDPVDAALCAFKLALYHDLEDYRGLSDA